MGGHAPATLATRTGRSTGSSREGATGANVGAARRASTRSARQAADNALRDANGKVAELQGQNAELQQRIRELQQSQITMMKLQSIQLSIDGLRTQLAQDHEVRYMRKVRAQTETFDIASLPGSCIVDAGDEVSEVGSACTVLQETLLEDELRSLSMITGVADEQASFALFRGDYESGLSISGPESHISPSTTVALAQDDFAQTDALCTQSVEALTVIESLPLVCVEPVQTADASTGADSFDVVEPQMSDNASQTVALCSQTTGAQTLPEVLPETPKVHDALAQTIESFAWSSEVEEREQTSSASQTVPVPHTQTSEVQTDAEGLPQLHDVVTDKTLKKIIEWFHDNESSFKTTDSLPAPHCLECGDDESISAKVLQERLEGIGVSEGVFRRMHKQVAALPFRAWESLPGTSSQIAQAIAQGLDLHDWPPLMRKMLRDNIQDGTITELKEHLSACMKPAPKAKPRNKKRR